MKSETKILIIDFYDSFTFNIASELFLRNIPCRVVPYDQNWKRRKSETVVIWGPGPGHPKEYISVYPQLKKLFENKNIFHMGICLGHQLFFYFSKFKMVKSSHPMHGQNTKLIIPKWRDVFPVRYQTKALRVQRYNSLAVKNSKSIGHKKIMGRKLIKKISYKNEVMMSYGENWISYQFHPESVGTEERNCFFEPLLKFLYN